MTPEDWQQIEGAIRVLATPILAAIGYGVRQLFLQLRTQNAKMEATNQHLAIANGRLGTVENTLNGHVEQDRQDFERLTDLTEDLYHERDAYALIRDATRRPRHRLPRPRRPRDRRR